MLKNKNNMGKETEFFITRHTIKEKEGEEKPSSKEYPGITQEGIKLAKERAKKDIIPEILNSPPGTIIFMGPVTELPRTRSTMKVYNETIQDELSEREEIEIFDREKLTCKGKLGPTEVMKNLISFAEQNPEKKIIINVPLFVKFDSERRKTQYFLDLHKRAGGKEEVFMDLWLEATEKGELKEGYPSPTESSHLFLEQLNRVENFIRKYFPERKVIIGVVGHASAITALAGYFLGEKKFTKEMYKKEIGHPLKETEMLMISKEKDDKDNKWKVRFREKVKEIEYEK